MRETLWAAGIAVVGTMSARSALATGSSADVGAAAALYLLAGWLVFHLFRRISLLTLETDQGSVRIDIEAKLLPEQIAVIRRRVRSELDWPLD